MAGIKERNTVLHQTLLLSPEDSIMWVIFFQCHYIDTFKKCGELSVLACPLYYWLQLITWKLQVSSVRNSLSSGYTERPKQYWRNICGFVLNSSYWWNRKILSVWFPPAFPQMLAVLHIKTESSLQVKALPYRISEVVIRCSFFLC